MFPNVRLLTVALFASVVALGCGFGLFAAFRVNHEPLSRLPAGPAGGRLVANEVAAPRAGWGTPFDGQSRASGQQRTEAAAQIQAAKAGRQSKLESSGPATVGAIKPAAASDVAQADKAQVAPAAPARIATATASVPNPSPNAGPTQDAKIGAPAPVAPEQSASVAAPAASAAPATSLPPQNAAKAAAPFVATTMPSDQPTVVSPLAKQVEPARETGIAPLRAIAKPARETRTKKESKATRKPVTRRRVATRRRIVPKWRRRASGQNTGFNNPFFQSAPNASDTSSFRTGANSSGWSNRQ